MERGRGWRVLMLGLVLAGLVGTDMVQAGDAPASYTAGDKLVRGLANVFLGFIEIPRNIHNTTEEESLLAGRSGLARGLATP